MKFIVENAKNKSFFPYKNSDEVSLIYKKISELSINKDITCVNKINESYFVKEKYLYKDDLNNYSTFKPGYNSD